MISSGHKITADENAEIAARYQREVMQLRAAFQAPRNFGPLTGDWTISGRPCYIVEVDRLLFLINEKGHSARGRLDETYRVISGIEGRNWDPDLVGVIVGTDLIRWGVNPDPTRSWRRKTNAD